MRVIANRVANLLAFVSLNLNVCCIVGIYLFESWPKFESGKNKKKYVSSTPAAAWMTKRKNAITASIHIRMSHINWIIISDRINRVFIYGKRLQCEYS